MIVGIIEGQIDRMQYSHIAAIYDENGRFPLTWVGDFMSGGFGIHTPLGTVFSEKAKNFVREQTHHTMVCYPAKHDDIKKITSCLTECLNKLDIPEGETVALHIPICPGETPVLNHYPFSLLGAIACSNKYVVVHYGRY